MSIKCFNLINLLLVFYAGLGKGAVFGVGNVYGGLAFKDRKKNKLLEQTVPFPDSVTRSQFYYMDQFILSASANKIHVHQVQSPNKHLHIQGNNKFFKWDDFVYLDWSRVRIWWVFERCRRWLLVQTHKNVPLGKL